MIFCLDRYRTFVQGSQLTIRTDHQALTFLKRCKLLSERLTWWVLFLQQFDHTIEHIRSTDNKVPDILLRFPVGRTNNNGEGMRSYPLVDAFKSEELKELRQEFKHLEKKQREDPELGKIIKIFEGSTSDKDRKTLRKIKNFKLR